jgi:hypothetical protein
MWNLFVNLFKTKNYMSAEEKWLSESVDLVELERRQKQLIYSKQRGIFN